MKWREFGAIRKVSQSDFSRQVYRDDVSQRYKEADELGSLCPLGFLGQCLILHSCKQYSL